MNIIKHILVLMLAGCAHSILAASIAWGCVNGEYRGSNGEFWLTFQSGTHVMDFAVAANVLSDGILISAQAVTMISFHDIVSADAGDIITEYSTRHLPHDAYFMHCYIDDEEYYGTGNIKVVPDEPFYFMMAIESYMSTDPMVLYGWMELTVDASGGISVTGSAIDLDGGPMVVGGGAWDGNIPEPSAGMLFLLGAAVLGLRRRLTSSICHGFASPGIFT